MTQLSIQEIREIEFKLLKVFDCFCKENNIKYFLSNGTLLGAVKYNGFIPWDDDVDILVPREDYSRLISLFCDSEQYRLFSFEKEENYHYPFAKLCDMTTRKVETVYHNGVELGVDIDIFPLDYWDNDPNKAKKEAKCIGRNILFLVMSKLRKPDSVNPIKRLIKGVAMAFCKMRGSRYFIKNILNASCQKNQEGSRYMGCKAWCIYGEREILPAQVFADTVEVMFEGESFPAPVGYDAYLQSLYGDYRKDPPPDKQKTHHVFTVYRL